MTPIPFGERTHPVWDALRVQTLMGIPTSDQLSGVSSLSGLGNSIILFHSSGADLELYDPTDVGLTSALAAAASGDTVWLPSIPIALTAGVTIPAGINVTGINHEAILSFSGFNGTAITLGVGAVVYNFTVTMVATGTTAIGVDATASGSVVDRMNVNAAGGSATNIAVDTGYNSIVVSSELWFAANSSGGNAIYWSNDFAGGSPTWHKVSSLPSGSPEWFGIASDGSAVYMHTVNGNIYKCTNPKSGSPTWNAVLSSGDSAAGGVVNGIYGQTFTVQGTKLYTVVRINISSTSWAYGVYDGASWTWGRTTDYLTSSPTSIGKDTYCFSGPNDWREGITNTLLESVSNAYIIGINGYRSPAGTRYASIRRSGVLYGHIVAGSDFATLGNAAFGTQVDGTRITGAEAGNQAYMISYADVGSGTQGHLYLSDNGSTFTDIATWVPGWVKDMYYIGGGDLVWVPLSFLSTTIPARLYSRAGTSLFDLTGNFWSLITGDQSVIGMGLVYP